MAEESGYMAKEIQVLTGLDGVRKRPGMYIGDTSKRGLHHLVYEIVDNSIDEALAGHCKNIWIELRKDGSARIKDDGRGIPVDMHPSGKSGLELVASSLHAGGKFDKSAYKVSGGLHGVGMGVVNGLSEWMTIEVCRDGKVHTIGYARGKPKDPFKIGGATQERGTTVSFKPDSKIFQTTDFDYEYLRERIMELAFLNKGLRIALSDERDGKKEEFRYDGGIVEFVKHINEARNGLHEPYYLNKKTDHVEVEIALQYTDGYSDSIYSFVNDIKTIEGGTHVVGFRTALTRAVNDYTKSAKLVKEERKITGDDAIEGLTAIISIKVPEPQFEGQTKTKLGNSEIRGAVDSLFYEAFKTYCEEHPHIAKTISSKIINSMEAREAAQKAKDLIRRKNVFESSVLPGKLADCSEEDPAKCEIYFVEGDSAGGCFSGDTKVALSNGRNLTFKELVEEDRQGKLNFCYTIKKDGRIGVAPILSPRVTRRNAEVVKVTLDNGEEFVCTPDHLFMLRDGSYQRADALAGPDSLMPLYRQHSKLGKWITIEGYEMVFDPKEGRWIFTHLLADEYNLANEKYAKEKNSCIHHVDFNKRNNNPTNLRRMGKQEHLNLHASIVRETMSRPEVLAKIREAHQSEEYRKRIKATMRSPRMRKLLSERAKKQWEDDGYKAYMTRRFLEFYANSLEYRKRNNELLNRKQQEHWASMENREKQAERVRAHYKEHPEKKIWLSETAKKQWNDEQLRSWRSQKTKEQWTPEFRAKRKAAYNHTYMEKALKVMRVVFEKEGELRKASYDVERAKRKDRSILKYETIRQRFFEDNDARLKEAVANYNHKIKNISKLSERTDVYDLEVEGTHNFALASGVFVHNSSKQARDRRYQAILPLRGKILNVEKAPIHKIIDSEAIRNIVLSLGAGFKEDFDMKKLRYHKIIVMTDADVDGSHIRTLILTLFYRYFKDLIDHGHLYIAQPPLYRIQKGKTVQYAYSDAQLAETLKTVGGDASIQHYKGLGEMNPDQLWETTMNPETRTLKKVTVEDAILADELFTLLMGDLVEPRRAFIELHGAGVKNLDI
ncbi:DNA topoisomerase (ATP-hydrolyzing) subunit B [Candidatus Micrarchaeota archaeon]|nr:DNA topoisomerase (ATP-hydrolyzing) subunit B [Candidatus Micrarchaeota archaeon]